MKKCTSNTDCPLSLTCCSLVLLIAIRQGEDSRELLEKTVLKLRVDQKGNLVNKVLLSLLMMGHRNDKKMKSSKRLFFFKNLRNIFKKTLWMQTVGKYFSILTMDWRLLLHSQNF